MKEFGLISGVFTPEEANEVLITLVDDKIRIHQRNNWSRRERFGESGAAGEERITELRKTRAELLEFLAEADSAGTKLSIRCNIEIVPAS